MDKPGLEIRAETLKPYCHYSMCQCQNLWISPSNFMYLPQHQEDSIEQHPESDASHKSPMRPLWLSGLSLLICIALSLSILL